MGLLLLTKRAPLCGETEKGPSECTRRHVGDDQPAVPPFRRETSFPQYWPIRADSATYPVNQNAREFAFGIFGSANVPKFEVALRRGFRVKDFPDGTRWYRSKNSQIVFFNVFI